jgi:O-antigen/teichoic acid export membrane protein
MRSPRTTDPFVVRLAEIVGIREAGRVLRHFAYSYLPNQALAAVAGAIALPILAHSVSPTQLGVLAIVQTLMSLGWALVGSWLGSAVIRELPQHREAGDLAAFRRTLTRGLGVVGLGLGAYYAAVAVGSALSDAIGGNAWLLVAAGTGLVVQNLAVALFAGSLRPHLYVMIDSSARIGGIAAGTILVLKGHGVGGYLAGIAAASLSMGAVGLWLGWPRGESHEGGDRLPLSPWLRFGLPSAAAGVATWGLAFADRYILAALRDASAVGVYSLGNMIGDKAIMIPAMAFSTAAGPLLITAWEKLGRGEVERLMRAYTRILLLIGLPTVAFLAATSDTIVRLIAPEITYGEASEVVAIVAAGSLIYALALIGYTGLIVSKRTTPMLYAAAIGLVVNVVANFALIPPFGIVGAGVATPLGMAAFALATQYWSRRFASWLFPWGTLLRVAAAALIGYVAARFVVSHVDSSIAALASAGGGFTLVYLGALVVLGERNAARPAA